MQGDLAASICAALVPLALFLAVTTKVQSRRVMAFSLTLLLCGKLFRVRSVMDQHVEPWIAETFGPHNIPVLMASSVVPLGYMGVTSTLLPRKTWTKFVALPGVALIVAGAALFIAAYGSHFREYLSEGGLDNITQGLAWLLPLSIVLGTSLVFIPQALKILREHYRHFASLILAVGLIGFGCSGVVYAVAKFVYLVLATADDSLGVLDGLETVTFITLPLSFVMLTLAVFVPVVVESLGRVRRFLHLRAFEANRSGDGPSMRELWVLADDPVAAHVHVVDAYDDKLLPPSQRV